MGIDLKNYLNENIRIRKAQTFKIQDRDEVVELFEQAFLLTDRTITDFNWLPEYDGVVDWLCNSEGKGICLAGSNGRGKSNIINAVIPLIFEAAHSKVLNCYNAREMMDKRLEWAVVMDDIGQDSVVNSYGTKYDPVENAICHCEERMKLLIMTTNLNKDQIRNRYGQRILDRINRLCKIVPFNGESFRK